MVQQSISTICSFALFCGRSALAAIKPGARLLDVGCGTGRWVRRYGELGFCAMGVDATIGMLDIARGRGTKAPLATGLAQSLPFADASFDCLSDITVVQHIPYELQLKALERDGSCSKTGRPIDIDGDNQQ